MSVYDFIELCVDDCFTLNIYDSEREEVVWSGKAYTLPEVYGYEELSSFDVPERKFELTVNIN